MNLYLKSVGLNASKGHFAWCAAFVHWCFAQAAGNLSVANPAPRTAGVHEMWRQAGASHLRRMTPVTVRQRPELVKPGHLFFLDTGGGTGHVGIIASVTGVVLTTIEGNSNDGGSREGIGVFQLNRRRIDRINLGVADFSSTF